MPTLCGICLWFLWPGYITVIIYVGEYWLSITTCIFLAQNARVELWKIKGVHFGAKMQLGREALSNLLTATADSLKCVIEICYTCICKALVYHALFVIHKVRIHVFFRL